MACDKFFHYNNPLALLRTPCGNTSCLFVLYRWCTAVLWLTFLVYYTAQHHHTITRAIIDANLAVDKQQQHQLQDDDVSADGVTSPTATIKSLDKASLLPLWCKAEVVVMYMEVMSLVLYAVVVTYEYGRNRGVYTNVLAYTPWYVKLTVAINTTATSCSVMLFALYILTMAHTDSSLPFASVCLYIVLPVLVTVDTFLHGLTWRLLHIVFPFFIVCIYFLFTLVFNEMQPGPDPAPIYSWLDWERHQDQASGAVLATIFVIFPITYLTLWLLYYCKYVMYSRCCKHRLNRPKEHVIMS